MMYYIFPFENLITVEFRHYNPEPGEPNRIVWPLRNYMWANAGPAFCSQVEANISNKTVRYRVIDVLRAVAFQAGEPGEERQHHRHRPDHPLPPIADASRYTFSLWAFPEGDPTHGR